MNKSQAKKKVFDYFKKNAIEYKFVNEELSLQMWIHQIRYYLCASIPEVIGGHIETCIRFREAHLYCQSYYCQPVVHNEEEAIRAARLINYLNRHLKYDCDKLYNHVYILDEDNGDIFNGCHIRYELFGNVFSRVDEPYLEFQCSANS